MNAVDTNVLLYVHDPRDARKRSIAAGLIESLSEPVLLWQVGCEFIAAARKLSAFGFGPEDAWRELQELLDEWALAVPKLSTWESAMRLLSSYSLSFWDAMIAAACLEARVDSFYTEDFG